MKTKLIISSLFVSSVFISAAHAYDGQIKFTGKITQTACKIDSNSLNQTVNMGTISSSSLDKAGKVSSPTSFSITLTDCPSEYKQAQVKFDGQPDINNKGLLALSNSTTSPSAKGVAIALFEDDSNTLIPLAQSSRSQKLSGQKTEQLNFIAKYIATTDQVEPGSGDSVANFTITYN
ncbi:fimbrial protein [Xenorhabdus sp. Reich]|uniref:Fimbrial protein n=1 Tax=Xenorhabdus littoralis TaxID=2582835 RepID=A0ABU4SLH1_9GAMM|nr:fimbrial protein [Xenorhabdus sp. Reich]MDX7999498.1 fimbrial protein [Xenorhabdus sp. Reich]